MAERQIQIKHEMWPTPSIIVAQINKKSTSKSKPFDNFETMASRSGSNGPNMCLQIAHMRQNKISLPLRVVFTLHTTQDELGEVGRNGYNTGRLTVLDLSACSSAVGHIHSTSLRTIPTSIM